MLHLFRFCLLHVSRVGSGETSVEGAPFGRYRLVELLGRGGMGEVWRAYDTVTNNRTVAIKVLPPHLAQDAIFAQRFRREADAAAKLNSPHVIPIHTYGEIDGRLYVDMRLVEGRDLQAVLADGPLEPERAVRIIEQVAKALHAAHKVGLVHRDVKPSNILLDEDDFVYLIDFGIARALDDTRMTGTGNTVGTFLYMAPERLSERPDEDARADIYALACVLYESLTGHPPFTVTSVGGLVAAHLNTPPPLPSQSAGDALAQFDGVIAKGMAKDPEKRFATTVELAQAAYAAARTSAPEVPLQHAITSDDRWQESTFAQEKPQIGHSERAHLTSGGMPRLPRIRRLWEELDHRTRWGLGLVFVLAVTAVVALVLTFSRESGFPIVPVEPQQISYAEDEVRTAIQNYDRAIRAGDLATLRAITCGAAHDQYVNFDDRVFAETHARVAGAKRYSVVANIPRVAVNGDHAYAEVTTFMAYDPATLSTRSLDLQFIDGEWKICQAP